MNLLDWLGGQVEGAFAQANPWDNGADYNSVQQRRRKEEQARAQRAPLRAPQFNPLKTVGDVAGGIGKGINDVATAVGGFVLPGTAKLTNQTLGIVENTGANIAGETQKLFGDKKGGQNTIDSVKRHVDQNLLAQGKGLFGQGGIYNSTDSLHNANPTEVLKKADDTGLIGKDINDVATAVGGFVLPGTAKFTNQTLGIIENTGANIVGETQKLFGDKKGGQNTIDSVKRYVDQNLLGQGKGLFGQGGIYNSTDSLHNANPTEVLRKAGGTGLEVVGEKLPVVRVAKGPTLGAKIVNNAIVGAVSNTLADVGSQYVQNGTVNPWQTAQSAAIGGAFGGAIPLVGVAVKPVGTKLVQTGQRAQNFGLLPPTKLTPEELFAAKKMRQAQQGLIDPRTVTTQDAILNNRAEKKLGQSPGTPQAWHEVNRALDAHRAFNVEVAQRAQAVKDGLTTANDFTKRHLIPGGTLDAPLGKKNKELNATQPTVAPKGAPIEKTNVLRDVPIADFKKTDITSWNEAVQNVSKGKFSKTNGPAEVVLTNNGYKLVEGNHRAVQALNKGDATIKAKVISKEGLDEIAKRDGPHIKMGMQDAYTQKQLDAHFSKSGAPIEKTPQAPQPEAPAQVQARQVQELNTAVDARTYVDNTAADNEIQAIYRRANNARNGKLTITEENRIAELQQSKAKNENAGRSNSTKRVAELANGEIYSMANADISRTKSPGMNQDGFTIGIGQNKAYVSLDKASPETRIQIADAEAEYELARSNSKGPSAPGTETSVTIAKRKVNEAYSRAIEELGLQDYATKVGGDGKITQRVLSARYGDWVYENYKSGKYTGEQIKDMEVNPQKYRDQFESESKQSTAVESQTQSKVPEKGNTASPKTSRGQQKVSSQRSARQAPSTDKKARTDRTYTDDNPDIDTEQYVKDMTDAQKAAQKGEKGYSKFKSDAKEKFIDDLSPIEDRLRKAINDGAQVDPKDHITYQLDRSRRSEGVMNAYVRDNGLDKIIQNVPDPNEFDQYLIARHAKELDPEIRTGRNAKADQALVKALNGKYDDYAKKLYAYNQKLLDTSVDYGLISKESAASLKKQYPDYVPFNRIFNEDELANLYGGNGKGDASLSSQGVVKSIKGSNRAIASPLNSIIDKTRVVIEQGERNRAAKILADYRQLPGNPFNLKEIPKGEAIGGRPTISFLDRGVKRTFETDKTIADAAKNMTRQDIGLWGRIAAVPARVLRGGATTVNIGFAGANVVKDVIGAAINSRHPFRIADPQALGKALAAALNHNGRYYQELMREGVAGTSFDMYRNPLKSNIGEIRSQKNFGTRALHNLRPDRWYRTLENAIGRSEDFGRALQYYSNKKGFEGKYGSGSKQAKILAADQARNNSTNFFRHGSYGKGINLAIPYWNAGVQGARIQTRRIVERPVQTIAKIGFTVAAPSAMIAANNYSTEKNRQVMEDIPQYEKDGNIIIVGPDAKLNKDTGRWEGVFKIPVPPQHMGIHKTIQDAVRAGFTGKPMDFLADAGAVTQNYTTINPVDAKATASSYVPQALKLVAEPMTNTNFFTGNKIVPDSQKNLPAADQYNDYTSGTAKTIGNLTNVSPRQIDNAIRTGMGGAGQNLVKFLDTGLAATGVIDKSEVKGQDVLDSITRRFYGAASINPSEKADEMFGEMKKKVTETDAYKNASQYDKGRMLNRLESDISAVSWHVSGKSDKDTKLTQKQQSLLVNGFNPDNYTNLTSSGGVSINNKLSSDSKTTLDKYNSLSDDDRTKWFSTENDAEYKYNLAKYENAKANGTLSTADDIRTKRSVYKDKVGSSYSKNVREMYTLSKTELADYLNTEDGTDKAKLYDELYAYDRALYDAGLVSSLKFKYGLASGSKSGKKGGKKGNGVTEGKAMVSLARQLNKLTTPKTTGSKSPAAGIKLPQLKKTALRKYTVKTAKVQKAAKPLKIKTSKA